MVQYYTPRGKFDNDTQKEILTTEDDLTRSVMLHR
jgi:hypothetical protein